jgi:hypothetical protein
MGSGIGTKLGYFTFMLFVVSAGFGSFFFFRGFLRFKVYSPTRTLARYALLEEKFAGHEGVAAYVESHKQRKPQHKQVYWMIIDGLPIYAMRPTQSRK